MSGIMQRARRWLTQHHFAQAALLVQPLIVVRTAGEYLRLKWAGTTMPPALLEPLFTSIAGVAVVAMISLLLYFSGRERSVIILTLTGIVVLIAYKLLAMPGLG